MSFLAGIAKAVAPSILGGLFGRSKPAESRVNFQQLRDDAAAAGFNPLTALLATGGAGNRIEHPAMSSGAFISEAVQRAIDTGFNSGLDRPDPEAKRAKLRAASGVQPPALLGPSFHLTDAAPMAARRSGDEAPSDRGVTPPERPLLMFGREFRPTNQSTDAETFEARYGDFASSMYGLVNLTLDAGANTMSWWRDNRGTRTLPSYPMPPGYRADGTTGPRYAPGWIEPPRLNNRRALETPRRQHLGGGVYLSRPSSAPWVPTAPRSPMSATQYGRRW